MTEETLKHELYKHGSYLHSLKESGSEFVNIDDEIQKLEELFQMAYKKDQPTFEVGEHYADEYGIYKILEDGKCKTYSFHEGTFHESLQWYTLNGTEPATAERIAEFKRAEHFAAHGRKLDEFRVGDFAQVIKNLDLFTVRDVYQRDDILYIGDHDAGIEFSAAGCIIDQTAGELREVENNESL